MLRLPRKLALAVEAVLDIALNGAAGPVASAEITGRQGIPRRYLEQVLQQLVRAGILSGTRGPRGGYRLALERRRITVAAILRAVGSDGGDGDDGASATRSALGQGVVAPTMAELAAACLERLDGVTIDDLCRRAVACGAHRPADQALDFSI